MEIAAVNVDNLKHVHMKNRLITRSCYNSHRI